jgi:hypothetical protein
MNLQKVCGILLGILLLGLTRSVGVCGTLSQTAYDDSRRDERPVDWGWALTLAGDLDACLGNYFTYSSFWVKDYQVGPGAGMEIRLARAISGSTALRLTFSDYGMDYRDDSYYAPHLDVKAITVGVQCYRWIDRFQQNRRQTYFSVDVGLLQSRAGGSNNPLIRPGAGIVLPILSGLRLDISAHMNLVLMSERTWNDTGSGGLPVAFILSGTAGLTWTI